MLLHCSIRHSTTQLAGSFTELVRSLQILHQQPCRFSSSSAAGEGGKDSSSSTSDGGGGQGDALAAYHRKVAALQDGQAHSNVNAWLRGDTQTAASGSSSSSSTSAAAGGWVRNKGALRTAAAAAAASDASGEPDGGGAAVSVDYGYAVLGGVDPEASQQVAGAQQPKLHPTRNFDVREMYSPLDLSPLSREEDEPWVPQMGRRGGRGRDSAQLLHQADEIKQQLDYKNIDLLLNFVTDSGRIKHRRQTRLKPRLQSRVARTIKLARQMALLPYEMRVGDGGDGDRWRRMREYRAAETAAGQR